MITCSARAMGLGVQPERIGTSGYFKKQGNQLRLQGTKVAGPLEPVDNVPTLPCFYRAAVVIAGLQTPAGDCW